MMDDKNDKTKRYITNIDFRTCDYDDAHHIVENFEPPIDEQEALDFIRHWALELIVDLKINLKTTSYHSLRSNQTINVNP